MTSRGGYQSGERTVSELPPPSPSVCAQTPRGETCCGFAMIWQDIFGIVRRYECFYRPNHPAVYVSLHTGLRVTSEAIPYQGFSDDRA